MLAMFSNMVATGLSSAPSAEGGFAVYGRTDQLLAGIERAAGPPRLFGGEVDGEIAAQVVERPRRKPATAGRAGRDDRLNPSDRVRVRARSRPRP